MKYAVLIKQVPNVSEMQFDPQTRRLRREGVRLEVSSFDVRALIRALELRAETGGEVTVLTMGPPQAREALVHCLALGADRGVHLVDAAFAGSDTLATARALALALRREGFGLVLCGKTSVDAETGQVGPVVVERQGRMFDGEPEVAVRALVAALIERGVFDDEPMACVRAARRGERPSDAAQSIWVLAEVLQGKLRRVTLELLGEAQALCAASAGRTVAILLGYGVRSHVGELVAHGADAVLVCDDPLLDDYSTDAYASVLAGMTR